MQRPLPRDAVLVVNAHSRRGQDLFTQAREKLEAAGIRLIAASGGDIIFLDPTLVESGADPNGLGCALTSAQKGTRQNGE